MNSKEFNRKIVAERLLLLAEQNGGNLTPDMVLKDAMDKASPLHKHGGFEWDIKKAAHEAWLDHCRQLIRTVRVEVHQTEYAIKGYAFVRDERVPKSQQGYSLVSSVAVDRDRALGVLHEEAEAIQARLKRLQTLSAQFNLEQEVGAIITACATFRDGVSRIAGQSQ